jgi:hypothetical protein
MGWTKYGKYREMSIEQTALYDSKGYLRLVEAKNEAWIQRDSYKRDKIEEVLNKLDNFIPVAACVHEQDEKQCGKTAYHILIKEWEKESYYDQYRDEAGEGGLAGLLVSHKNVLCDEHKDMHNSYDEGTKMTAKSYPINFGIIRKFAERNEKNCHKMHKDAVEKIFKELRKCTGFDAKLRDDTQYCNDFIRNLKQKPKK